MSIDDGGSPFVAVRGASITGPSSGAWTVTVRNTGTVASSGTTQVEFNAAVNGNHYGYLQDSLGGTGWSCDNTGYVATCTNTASVPAGGSLPVLKFPFAALPGYGFAPAQATLTNPSDGTINNDTLNVFTPVVEKLAVNLSMSIDDGGSPFVAVQGASITGPSSGAWTVTVRNTGTVASSGTTQVEFNAAVNGNHYGYLQDSLGGTGWSCDNTGYVATCTNAASVPAGGSLPVLKFPFAALPGYGFAPAQATLTNPSDGTINNDTLNVFTPVDEATSTVDVVANISDGGAPFTAGTPATYSVTVRNVGTSNASGDIMVHYPIPFAGMVATGTGWTCTASTVTDPTCTHPGGLAAGSSLPPVTISGPVPAQDAPATVEAKVTVDNSSDAVTDNFTYLDTSVTPVPIDVVATVSDRGFPFVFGKQGIYVVAVRNVGTSPATGDITVHYPIPLAGMVATGTGWTCTASTVTDPTCTHPGGLAAGSSLPPVTISGPVPAQNTPATVEAKVTVDNSSDAFTRDNYTYLDTGVTSFQPPKLIYGSTCPDVMVMAVRGSGESPQADWTDPAAYINDTYRGVGEVNWDLYGRLLKARPKLHISLDPIMYPADAVMPELFPKLHYQIYQASVASGVETLLSDMQLTDSQCGGTVRYILTGYSQGAWAVHDALYQMKSDQLGRIIGVALFGDPDFKAGQSIVRDFKSADTVNGVSAGVDSSNLGVPSVLTKHSGSWCYSTDPICQFPSKNPNIWVPLCGSSSCAVPGIQLLYVA